MLCVGVYIGILKFSMHSHGDRGNEIVRYNRSSFRSHAPAWECISVFWNLVYIPTETVGTRLKYKN